MKQLPNIFTLLNLVFGCLAIFFILQSGEVKYVFNEEQTLFNLPEKMWLGALFIAVAAVIDFLDGFVARLFNATSEIGKQLDSLADVVSFGVAPGMILLQLIRYGFMQQPDGMEVSIWALLPAVLFPCAGAYRLARFNTDPGQESSFKGVPIPAAGLVVASFPLIIFYNTFNTAAILINTWVLYAVTIVLSYLMISTIPMMAMKFKDYSVKNNLAKYLLLTIGIVAAFFLKWLAVPFIFVCYILLSLLASRAGKNSQTA
jgi:CDP-diacylglycerol---serine O-phosphatidyltransferase